MKILTTTDVAELLSCSRHVVNRLIADGRLKCVDIGTGNYHVYRFRHEDIERFMNEPEETNSPVSLPEVWEQNKPVNTADKIAIEKLRKRGVLA